MPVLSYDLHVHPGPSKAPRWGTGTDVLRAAEEAGVHGFVWKAHEQHTQALCAALPPSPVRAFGSASLNPWAALPDVVEAVADGARWLWGPTVDDAGDPDWDLALPSYWDDLADELRRMGTRVILGTGHLDPAGREEFVRLAATSPHLMCSVTHTLYVPLGELLDLAAEGAAFEIDGYTLRHDLPGRVRYRPADTVAGLLEAGALVYFTSDGGQASTGNPFTFGAESLALLGDAYAEELGIRGPSAVVAWLDGGEAA